MYNEMLQALISLARSLSLSVMVGTMPPDNGFAMSVSGGIDNIQSDNGGTGTLNVILNGKNSDQETVIVQLNAIHARLTRRQDFPASGNWQIYSIRTVSAPRLIGREQNSQYLYGSSLAVKFYEKGIN